MYTKSAVILWLVGFLKKLNYYFEYSFIYKMLTSIGKAAKSSKLLKMFMSEKETDYAQGSFLLRPLLYISWVFMGVLKVFFKLLKHLNRSSINKKLFDTAITPLKTTEGLISAICLVLGGIMLVIGISSFGSVLMVAGVVAGVVFIVCGVFLPEFLATAFRGCFPMWLIKWFFSEE